MALYVNKTEGGRLINIKITGRFDFSNHRDFRQAYGGTPKDISFFVDLTEVEYLDSSALGMLLLLRDHAADPSRVTISAGAGQPRDVLRLAHFNDLFKLI